MNQSNNGKETCGKCHGRGYHTRDSIDLKTICKYCGGKKEVDWIEYMTGNPTPFPYDVIFRRDLAIQNVQYLIHKIKHILIQEGIHAMIKVEQYQSPEYKIRYGTNCPSFHPLLKPKILKPKTLLHL